MKKGIAFFDFDGTITTKDTLLEFIKFSKGVMHFYVGFLLNSPYLLAYKLKIISNQSAKEKVLRFFFGKMALDQFNETCDQFSIHAIPGLIRPNALKEIEKLRDNGFTIVIVSASPNNWISKWAAGMGAELIATELESQKGLLTGKIVGKNCHGEEKVTRIKNKYNLSAYETVYAYGDSSGDQPMLSLAKQAYYKPFR